MSLTQNNMLLHVQEDERRRTPLGGGWHKKFCTFFLFSSTVCWQNNIGYISKYCKREQIKWKIITPPHHKQHQNKKANFPKKPSFHSHETTTNKPRILLWYFVLNEHSGLVGVWMVFFVLCVSQCVSCGKASK